MSGFLQPTTVNGVVMQIGGVVLAGLPNLFLYTNNAGNLWQDPDASRDSVTNDTFIAKDAGGFINEILVGDVGGFDATAIVRAANVGTLDGIIGVIDGTILGRDAATIFIDHTDATGNINGNLIMDSIGVSIGHDNITSNTSSLILDASNGAFLTFNDGNSANTFSRFFYVDTVGMGWSDGVVGYSFRLPQAVGIAGSVPTDVLGNGVLTMQPGGGGGLAIGNPVLGGTPTEVLYIDNAGNLFSDSSFYRDSVTNDTVYLNTIMETGYTVGLVMDDTIVPNGLIVSYYDGAANKGALLTFKNNRVTNVLRDATVPGFNPTGGMDVDFTGIGRFSRFYYQDTSTPNKSSEFLARQNDLLMRHYYNLSGNLFTTWEVTDLGIESKSSFLGGNLGVNFDYSANDWSFGDLSQTNNGLIFSLDDGNHAIDFGDPGGIEGGVVFALRNNSAGTRQVAFGSLSGTDGMRFELDLNGRIITMGDTTNLVNGTILELDDPSSSFQVRTNLTELMANVSGTATNPVSFGWRALQSVTTGVSDTAFGYNAGRNLTSGNDNVAIGNVALEDEVGGDSNTAVGTAALGKTSNINHNVGIGREAGYNLTDGGLGSGHGENNVLIGNFAGLTLNDGFGNTFIGHETDSSATTRIGAIALGNSAVVTANNQFMVGGANNQINTMVLGGGDTAASAVDVLFRINNATGTDTAGKHLKYQPGLGTGTGGSGEHQWFTAPAGATGTTLNTSTKVLSLDLNGNLRAYTLHNNATAQGSATQQDIRSGTYTPALTNVTNITASTAYQCQWSRVGNVVTVSGKVDIDATLGIATELGISLPVASNLGAEEDLAGTAACSAAAGLAASIRADAGNDRASLQYVAVSLTNDSYFFTFTYEVI